MTFGSSTGAISFFAAVLVSAAALGQERIVSAHFMAQESIGAEHLPLQGHLMPTPSRSDGIMALHAEDYLKDYRRPQAAAEHDIAEAKRAGVNTFNMWMLPTLLPNSQFVSVVNAYWSVANNDPNFKMDLDLWVPANADLTAGDKLAAGIKLLLQEYPNAWRKYHGRYIIYAKLDDIENELVAPQILSRILSAFGGKQNIYLILYGPASLVATHNPIVAEADAFSDWPTDDFGRTIERIQASAKLSRSLGKDYWYPIMPGFQESRPKLVPNLREKLGMTSFIATWRAALSDNFPGVNLTTWNDLSEDTAVMPESNHSDAFTQLNRHYSDLFISPQETEPYRERVFLFHHPETITGLLLPPGRLPVHSVAAPADARIPPTDYVGIVTMLARPATVTLMFGEARVASRTMPAGETAWLLYYPAAGAQYDKYLGASSVKVTKLASPIQDTEVYVSVERNDLGTLLFRSHRPITGAAGRGNLATVGDVFVLK